MASQWPEWVFPTSSFTASQAHLFPKAFSMPEIVLFSPSNDNRPIPAFSSLNALVSFHRRACARTTLQLSHVWTVGSRISMADLLSSMQTEMVSTWISSMCVEMIQQN